MRTELPDHAPRLLRKLRASCATEAPLDEGERAEFEQLGLPVPAALRKARGCASCGGTGYSGRTSVFEVLRVDDSLRDAIARRAPLSELRSLAEAAGMRSLRYRGLQLAAAGVTTIDEVRRHTVMQ